MNIKLHNIILILVTLFIMTLKLTTFAGTNITMEYGDTTIQNNFSSSLDTSIVSVNSDGQLVAQNVGTTTVTDENGEEFSVTVNPATVDLILFTGQSNMVGRATETYTADIPAGQAYEYRWNGNTLVSIENPVGEGRGPLQKSLGSSIVPEFVRSYVEKSGRKVVAVHAAQGGQAILKFTPDYVPESGDQLYEFISKKYIAAEKYINNNKNFKIGRKFYIMFQGESDNYSTSKTDYMNRYMQFHNALKKDFAMEFGAMIHTCQDMSFIPSGIITVAQAKNELAYANDDIIIISKLPMHYRITNDYNSKMPYLNDDNCHFNEYGLKNIASDAAANL